MDWNNPLLCGDTCPDCWSQHVNCLSKAWEPGDHPGPCQTMSRTAARAAGRRGGAGGGHHQGGMKKQEVETENHGQLEFHLIEINEDEEGRETSGGSLGENVVIALASIAAIIILCICSGCSFMAYRCGLCPKRRGCRRRHLSLSSISSGCK